MFAKRFGLKQPVALANSIRGLVEKEAKHTECAHTPSQRSHVDRDNLQQQLYAQLELKMKSRKRKHITWELPDTDKPQPTYTSKQTRRKGYCKVTKKYLGKIQAIDKVYTLLKECGFHKLTLNVKARTFGGIPWEDLPDYTVNFKTHSKSKAFLTQLREDNLKLLQEDNKNPLQEDNVVPVTVRQVRRVITCLKPFFQS